MYHIRIISGVIALGLLFSGVLGLALCRSTKQGDELKALFETSHCETCHKDFKGRVCPNCNNPTREVLS